MTDYEKFINENPNALPIEIWDAAINSYTSSVENSNLIDLDILSNIIHDALVNMNYKRNIDEFIDSNITFIEDVMNDELDKTIQDLVAEEHYNN